MGAVSLLWAAVQHPYIAATMVVSLLLLIVVFDAIEMGRRRAIPAPGTLVTPGTWCLLAIG